MKRSLGICVTLIALTGWMDVKAQDRIVSPGTGYQPAHSYSISEIETIDNATGNLFLHIPITQLPAGPGGFTAGLTLTYNNRYWETEPLPESDTIGYLLRESPAGGWRLAMAPTLDLVYVESSGTSDPCGNYSDLFQLALTNPDGSRNQFLISYPTQSMPTACEAGTYRKSQVQNVASVWYTADGSYMRLQIEAASGTGWPNNASWTVYRQDGSSIHFDVSSQLTYLRDRQGNQITISKGVDSNPYEIMTDDFGRSIRLDHYTNRDEVSQTGHNGQAMVWKVYYGSAGAMTPSQYKYETKHSWTDYFDSLPPVATSLELPNGLSYTFGYTPTGSTSSNYRELRTITLPTGGVVEYGYRLDTSGSQTYYYHILANTIKSKKVTINSTVVENWSYDYQVNTSTGAYSHSEITAPDGGVTSHDFHSICYKIELAPNAGVITKTVNPDGSIMQREWAYNDPYEAPSSLSYPNPWIRRVLATTANASGTPVATSIKVFTADKNGNTTSVEERGWVAYNTTPPQSSSAALLRKTLTTYMNGAGDSANTGVDTNAYSYASLSTAGVPRNFVTSSELQNSSGVVKSRSQYGYTETNTTQHAWNLTAEYHWDSTKASSISPGATLTSGNSIGKSYTYTDHGNLSSETDGRGTESTYEYGNITGCPPDNNTRSDLYLTEEHHGSYGSGSLLDYAYGYNCYSGKRTTTTDPNSLVTTVTYDNYGRPTATTEGSNRKTVRTYSDANRWVVTQSDVESYNDLRSVSILHYDELGRLRLARQLETTVSDPATAAADETAGIKVDTKYVFATNHHEAWVSNPYRNSETTAPTRGWTAKRLDKVGRVCVEERFAGASDPTVASNCTPSSGTTGASVYSYDATLNYTLQTVTDAAGKTRSLYQDVMGRLIAVREDPSAAKYDTYYEYDLLGNLTWSRQAGSCSSSNPVTSPCSGGQTRTFSYDSLARVATATNPELGGNSLSYWYDDNGNVVDKMSSGSPGLLTSYTYDSLNRLQTKEYSDGTTAPVTYCYDGRAWDGSVGGCSGTPSSPSKRQLTEVGSTVSRMWYEYNALGQITSSTQTTAGQSFEFSYTYTAGGALASETYPSGRVMTTVYDDAGRPKYVKGQNGDVTTYYAGNQSNAIQYASHGGISSMTMGNGITESRTYNSSLQPTVIQAGSLLTILNCYQTSDDPTNCGSLPVAGNNGNVQRQKITRGGQSWDENYTYDAVNRLATATETGVWSQTYGYDAYGNRWLSASSGVPVSSLTPTSSTNFNAATNRLTGSNTYDSRGNLTTYGSYTLVYDGEGRVVTASGVTPSTKYEYDGEGHRVRAHSCSGSTTCEAGSGASTTLFVYDAFGRLAVEYRPDAVAAATSYYTQDHLGSTRLETDASGQAVKCTDYVPFGEEIPAGYGSRSSCFNSNDNRIKYTGKERDGETGLDYFLARYYSGVQGRFTSPDPLMASAYIADPQTWNRYAYVRNNPINMIDPDGMSTSELQMLNQLNMLSALPFVNGISGSQNPYDSYLPYYEANQWAFNNNVDMDFWALRNDQITANYGGLPEGVVTVEEGSKTVVPKDSKNSSSEASGAITTIENPVWQLTVWRPSTAVFDGSNFTFNGVTYTAVSGNSRNTPLLPGLYKASFLRNRTESGYVDPNGLGWSVNLDPLFGTARTLLRIHPDGGPPGTLGCIGIKGDTQYLKAIIYLTLRDYDYFYVKVDYGAD
jgi:RHS repeat-associated protein